METNTKTVINKTANGLGFMLFAVTAVMYGLTFLLSLLLYKSLNNTAITIMSMFISIASMFMVGLFYCWFSKTDINSTISFSRIDFSTLIMLVAIGTAVAISADYITDLLSLNLRSVGMQNGVDLNTHSSNLLNDILSVVSIAIIPPLAEEFLFRGIILGKLRRFGDGFAIILSSSLFAILHMNIVQIPFAFIVGIVLAFVTVKTNSLLPAVLIHFTNNFRSVLVNLLSDSKIIDEGLLNILYIAFVVLVFIAGIVSAVIMSRKKGFFKIESNSGIAFKDALGSSVLSAGMITFIVISTIITLTTIRFG